MQKSWNYFLGFLDMWLIFCANGSSLSIRIFLWSCPLDIINSALPRHAKFKGQIPIISKDPWATTKQDVVPCFNKYACIVRVYGILTSNRIFLWKSAGKSSSSFLAKDAATRNVVSMLFNKPTIAPTGSLIVFSWYILYIFLEFHL